MKIPSVLKENISYALSLFICAGMLYLAQSHQIAPKTDKVSTVLSDRNATHALDQNIEHNDVNTNNLRGNLVSTNTKPEANYEVTFYLREYTDHPSAIYYLRIGDAKINFHSGQVKYRFPNEGFVSAELRCAYNGRDVLLDKEVYEVTKPMQRPSAISVHLEEDN